MPLVFNLKLRETSNSREFKGLSTHLNPEGFRLMWPHFFQPWQDRCECQECQEHADLSLNQLIYQWFIIVSTVQRSASLIATAATGSRALPNQRWDAGTRSWKHCIIRLRNAFIRKLCTTWNKCEPTEKAAASETSSKMPRTPICLVESNGHDGSWWYVGSDAMKEDNIFKTAEQCRGKGNPGRFIPVTPEATSAEEAGEVAKVSVCITLARLQSDRFESSHKRFRRWEIFGVKIIQESKKLSEAAPEVQELKYM